MALGLTQSLTEMSTRNILLYKSQQGAQVAGFILSDNYSTCFGCHHHPSSGAQIKRKYSIW